MKKEYKVPLTVVVEGLTRRTYLISASTGGEQILTGGGGAKDHVIVESDDKDDEDVFDDLW